MTSRWREQARTVITHTLQSVLRIRARRFAPLPRHAILLVVAPHPDDESLGCARLIRSHASAGGAVHVVWLTDGEASHHGVGPGALARRRAAEADAAAAELGVGADRCHHLQGPDGRLDRLTANEEHVLRDQLKRLMRETAPALVVVTSALDGSTEHAAAHRLVVAAVRGAETQSLLRTYLVWAHWNVRALATICRRGGRIFWHPGPSFEAARRAAIAAHASQHEPPAPDDRAWLHPDFLACFPQGGEFFLEQ